MKLSEFKSTLSEVTQLKFMLPNGTLVPAHFHVTELALISKNFMDCGGVARVESLRYSRSAVAKNKLLFS